MGMENMFGWNENTPPRRMMETTGAYDGGLNIMTTGLTSGTRVATSMGWRQVNAIAVGPCPDIRPRYAKSYRSQPLNGMGRCALDR